MTGITLTDAINEIENVKRECLQLIADLDAFSPPDVAGLYQPTFRLIAAPMFYSAWERCFTLCNSVALRLIRDKTKEAGHLKPPTRALWLQVTPFFASFSAKLQQQHVNTAASDSEADHKAAKPGRFNSLTEFLDRLEEWSKLPLDSAIDTGELVMTFSNVNPTVVKVNAQALGIAAFPAFKGLKIGRLNNLVGVRNDIGHGAIIKPPENEEFCDLRKFTIDTVTAYCDIYSTWLSAEYPEPKTIKKMLRDFLSSKWLGL